jgi:hypothetical protein
MVLSPMIRGLLGIEAGDGGHVLNFAPQLPADWDRVTVRNVAAGAGRYDLSLTREPGVVSIAVDRRQGDAVKLVLAPAFPMDARVRTVSVDGRDMPFQMERRGDVQRAVVAIPLSAAPSPPAPSPGRATRVVFSFDEGTEVFAPIDVPARGATSEGLRILRSRAEGGTLRLTLEGVGGRTYVLGLRSHRTPGEAPGVTLAPKEAAPGPFELRVAFDGPRGEYVRRTIDLPLR